MTSRTSHVARRTSQVTAVLLAASVLSAHDLITSPVTWNSDVARIVEARCVRCHAAGGRGPMPLTTYAEARPWARAIKEEVLTRRMPKWHAARGYGAFANDPSLSSFEIALIAAWADGGAPRGNDPAKRPAEATQPATQSAPGERQIQVLCRNQRLPEGSLLAVRPQLASGRSIGLAVRQPDRSTEVVAWVRDYNPKFPETYRLRTPIRLTRNGQLIVQTDDTTGSCRLSLTVAPLR